MPNDTESVVYEYIGDVTSLRKATEQAIGFLNSYQKQIDRISADGGFGKNVKSAKSFQTAVKAVTKDITAMQSKIKDITDVKLSSDTGVQKQITESLSGLAQVQTRLQTVTGLTTKEVQALTAQLRSSRQSLQSSSAGVDALVAKEVKFQQTLETTRAKVSQFRDSVDSIKTRVSSVFDPLISRLNSLRNPFARIVQTVQTFKDKAAESFGRISQVASTVSSAFRRVSNSEDAASNAATRASRVHSGLASVLERMRRLFHKETKAIETEEDSLDHKNETLNSSTRNHRSLGSVILDLLGVFNRESRSITNMNIHMGNMFKKSNLVRGALRALTGLQLGRWLAEAAKQSIKFTENLNLFTVAMGDAYEQGLGFVTQMQELYGMDPSNLMRYAGNFYQLADAIQMPDQAAANLSLGLTKATNDIASLFNVDIETVFENLSSGMQGMSRAVRKYGMDIRTVTLQTTAASLGITAQVESMSEANRQGLRFITMMQQASNATGDFARTIETPANQLRIFKEQMSQLGRAIGDLFIGPLGKALQHINGFIMALRIAIQFVGDILGLTKQVESSVEIADDASDAILGIGSSADTATKKLKNMLAPFDELNLLQSKDDSDGLADLGYLDPKIEEAIANMKWELEDVRMKANEVRDALLAFFGFTVDAGKIVTWDSDAFEKNLIEKFPEWTSTIQAAFTNWTGIVNGFKAVLVSLGEVMSTIWDKVAGPFTEFVTDDSGAKRIEGLSTSLEKLASIISDNKEAIANFAIGFTAVSVALKGLSGIAALAQSIGQVVSRLGGVTPALLRTLGIIGLVVAAIALLYKNSTKFASSFRNLLSSVVGGITKLVQAALSVLSTVWDGIKTLWANNIQPMLTAVGDALAPVLDTVASLFGNVVDILVNVFNIIAELWTSTLQPVLAALFDAITGIAIMFEQLWSATVGPILEYIGNGLSELWESTLGPIVQQVIEIVGALIEVILALWNTILAPLLSWLLESLGPSIKMIFETAWDIISAVIRSIGSIISDLLTTLKGLLDFLAGVFTGDWERAWKGLVNILVGVGNAIIGVFELCVNAVISIINGLISVIYSAIVGLINMITGAVEGIAEIIGYDLELTITAAPPKIPALSMPRVPEVALARGAVVTGPTNALIGEGRYDEAVIPLGNSPQMNEFASSVADKVNSGEQIMLLREQNELLRQILDKTGVNLDGKSISDSMSMYQRNRARGRGV